MSTATRFKYPRLFPFCVSESSADHSSNWSYVDNLTLAEVMQFAWNLEGFTLTMNGIVSKGAASVNTSGTISNNTATATNYDRGGGGGMWIPTVAANTVWASWPSPKTPRERICSSDTVMAFGGNNSSDPTGDFFEFQFDIGTDPNNSGRFRIYYYFIISLTDQNGTDTVQAVYSDPSNAIAVSWNSGTFELGGIDFDWASSYSTGGTPTGAGSLSCAYGEYTY